MEPSTHSACVGDGVARLTQSPRVFSKRHKVSNGYFMWHKANTGVCVVVQWRRRAEANGQSVNGRLLRLGNSQAHLNVSLGIPKSNFSLPRVAIVNDLKVHLIELAVCHSTSQRRLCVALKNTLGLCVQQATPSPTRAEWVEGSVECLWCLVNPIYPQLLSESTRTQTTMNTDNHVVPQSLTPSAVPLVFRGSNLSQLLIEFTRPQITMVKPFCRQSGIHRSIIDPTMKDTSNPTHPSTQLQVHTQANMAKDLQPRPRPKPTLSQSSSLHLSDDEAFSQYTVNHHLKIFKVKGSSEVLSQPEALQRLKAMKLRMDDLEQVDFSEYVALRGPDNSSSANTSQSTDDVEGRDNPGSANASQSADDTGGRDNPGSANTSQSANNAEGRDNPGPASNDVNQCADATEASDLPNDNDSAVKGRGTDASSAANGNDPPVETSDAEAGNVDTGSHEKQPYDPLHHTEEDNTTEAPKDYRKA
ncbi:hypothetical protein BU15DRAFT_66412 [Melanogaster broomeanus]|nr:hypothetical protein BU15DRAFT_66412 [Melanogaster broomeanus]